MGKTIFRFGGRLLLLCLSAWLLFAAAGCGAKQPEHDYLTTRAALAKALAEKQAEIYVGDIDFDASDIYLTVSQNVRLIGRPEGSVFRRAQLLLQGSPAESELITVSLENITFDGCYEMPAGDPADFASFKAFHGDRANENAIHLSGYLDASFTNCSFLRYCAPAGAALMLSYTDGNDSIGTRASLRLDRCTFSQNTCQKGVLWCGGKNTRCEIVDTVFTDNNAYTGVVVLGGVTGTVRGLVVKDNNRPVFQDNMPYITSGGGLLLIRSDMTFEQCVFSGNSAPNGGGVGISSGTVTFADCEFTNNTADGFGGGLYIGSSESGPVYITDCLISGNRAAEEGAVYVLPADQINIGLPTGITEFSFCTIEDNASDDTDHLRFHPVATEDVNTTIGRDGRIDFYACRITDPDVTAALRNGENGNVVNAEGRGEPISAEIRQLVANGRYADYKKTLYAGVIHYAAPQGEAPRLWPAIVCIASVALVLTAVVFLRRRRNAASAANGAPASAAPPPEVNGMDVEALVQAAVSAGALTDREQDVLRKYLLGKKRSVIAEELFISESTVKNHVSRIFSKLDVKSKAELLEKLSGKD